MAEEFELLGTKEVLDALTALSSKEMIKVIKAVERRALSTHIVKPIRSGMPYGPKSKKTLGVITSKNDPLTLWGGVIAKKRERVEINGRTVNPPPQGVILRWVEGGTAIRKTEKGYNRGAIEGNSTIYPIIERNIPNVLKFFNEDFGEQVNLVLEKKLKKFRK